MSDPHQQQTMKETSDAAIGMFGLIALVCLFVAWLWFRDEPLGQTAQRFNVIFSDIDGLNENAAVRVNGVRVGAIEKLTLTPDNHVQVNVKVTSGLKVPEGAQFEIVSDGLIGAKMLQIQMPSVKAGQAAGAPLSDKVVVRGRDPSHPERKLYAFADQLEKINIAKTEEELRYSAARLAAAADQASAAARDARPALAGLNNAALSTSILARNAQPAVIRAERTLARAAVTLDRATIAASGIADLTGEWRGTGTQISKMLNDPKVSADLKQVAESGREIADKLERAVCTLNHSLADETLRTDVLTGLEKVRESTANIRNSIASLENVVQDPALRGEVTKVVGDARKTLESVNALMKDIDFNGDVKCTMAKFRAMADRIDQVGAQVGQVLDKRAPGLQLMLGRPGHLKHPVPEPEQCAAGRAAVGAVDIKLPAQPNLQPTGIRIAPSRAVKID